MNEQKENLSNDTNVIDASGVTEAETELNNDSSDVVDTSESHAAVTSTEATEMEKKKKKSTPLIAAVIIVVLGAVAWMLLKGGNTEISPSETQGASVTRSYPDVVAVVNGLEIPKEEMVESVANVGVQAQSQGMDVSSEEVQDLIEQQAIDGLVNTKLLIQAAIEAGITVTDEEIQAQIATIETQLGGAEVLAARVDELGLTMEDVEQDVREQILIDEYIRRESPGLQTEVTAEEIEAFYNQLIAGAQGQEVPSLEEVGPQIEAQLVAQNEQQAVADNIEELRNSAEIELNF